jgi:iron complex outermembrane receptor protein/vitamin B12 transporter
MKCVRILSVVCALACLVPGSALAQQRASIAGTVKDPLGASVGGATLALLDERQTRVADATSSADGTYTFPNVAPGRYDVVATASGFEPTTAESIFVGAGSKVSRDLTLRIGQLQQAVVVTAAASGLPQTQTGAPVTVLDSSTLDALNKPDVLEALRLVPGAQIAQTGSRGGTASMFIRGGAANFNKVLIDGVVANDIGGGFDFAQLSTVGVDRVEVLRQTNSVVYGADALAGVVSVTTRRGRTRTPEAELFADAGNLDTGRGGASLGGVAGRADYFSGYSYFTTDNDTPNSEYHNGTYSGRFGVALGHGSDLSATLRRTDTEFGNANGFTSYGIADDSMQKNSLTYAGVALQSQLSNRLQTTVRFGSTDFTLRSVNPTPTGEGDDPFGFGANYLGQPVTLTGANGYTVSGRAILDFSGTYPLEFDTRTTRRAISGQATIDVTPSVAISAGGRYERESAYTIVDAAADASRDNGGVFVEGRGAAGNRVYVTAGLGYERNAAFGSAVVPRLSVAAYLRDPASSGIGDTKVTFNAGTGIKAPGIAEEQSSLYALVQGTTAAAGVEPIGPERNRSFDIGLEQGFAGGAGRARIAYFHNDFNDLIEFLSQTALPLAGVPVEVANSTDFGAYINSQSYRAQGLELSSDAVLGRDVRVMASYTYLDAEVTKAFSATTSFNPQLPGIAIGAFSPLVGARPFRRPVNSGNFSVIVTPGRAQLSLSAYFAGKRDDSMFLIDRDFGNSLLLPNHDLDAAYQKVDLSGAYRFGRRVQATLSIENLLNQDYQASFGFPALPITARAGVRILLGGDGSRP